MAWSARNAGASLVDLGDGIGCIELHSLKNAIGGDVLALISSVLKPDSDAVRDFAGFVIAGDRDNFSVGANLMQLLLAAQEGEWDEVAAVIHGFQQMTAAIKFCPRPVVAAPFGLTLGGGAEICLHAARRQAARRDLYRPGRGGRRPDSRRRRNKGDAAARRRPGRGAGAARPARIRPRALPSRRRWPRRCKPRLRNRSPWPRFRPRPPRRGRWACCRAADRITMNRERLLLDAKAQAATLAEAGYVAPQPRTQIPAPGTAALATLETGVFLMGEAGYASEHDQKVARWAAYILAGGRVTAGTLVSEQYLLDLEREAFLSLAASARRRSGSPLR